MLWQAVPLALVAAVGSALPAGAQPIVNRPAWGSVGVPGGVQAARLSLGVGPVGDRPDEVLLLDYIDRYTALRNARIGDTADQYFRFLEAASAAFSARPDGCALPAPGAPRRVVDEQEECLAWLGLRLRQRDGVYAIEAETSGTATRRREWLAAAGVDPLALSAALNRGASAPAALPMAELPLPLPAFWSEAVFSSDRPDVVSILVDHDSAWLYRGLVALDADTQEYLAGNHALVRRLRAESSAAFGAFARSLRVRDGGFVPPGGDEAAPVWRHLVGQATTDVAAFLPALFSRDDGRLAYFHDAVARLDPVRQRFLLASHLTGRDRLNAVEHIYSRFREFESIWNAAVQPLSVPPFDPAVAIALVDVRDDGTVGADWWPSLLERVVGNDDWPNRPDDTLRRLRAGQADARWYLDWVFERQDDARRRFELLRYMQRQFASASRDAAPAIETALRTMHELPALALALERMAVEDPVSVGAIGRRARDLTRAGSRDRVVPDLIRWQSALGWVEQLHRHGVLTSEQTRALAVSLADSTPVRGDRRGVIGAWFAEVLWPAIAGPDRAAASEGAVGDVIFGYRGSSDAAVVWEGLEYRVDRWGPAARAFDGIRATQIGPGIVDLLRLQQIRRAVESEVPSLEALAELVAMIEAIEPPIPAPGLDEGDVDSAIDAMETVARNLTRIRQPRDLPRAARERDRLSELTDALTSAVLQPTLYALAAAPTTQPSALLADRWRRHEWEVVQPSREGAGPLVIWDVPAPMRAGGGGAAVTGSWLALDLAVADSRLSDVGGDGLMPPPVIYSEDRAAVVASLAIRDHAPADDLIAGALAAGRATVADLIRSQPSARAIREALAPSGADPWRLSLMSWLGTRAPDRLPEWLTVTELYWLGGGGTLPPAWGVAGPAVDGCLCFEPLEVWMTSWFRDRPGSGLAGSLVSDLPLRLTEHLESVGLPTSLVPFLLRGAVRDWLGRIWQVMPTDAAALASFPRHLAAGRLDDYLLALVADGLLTAPNGGTR